MIRTEDLSFPGPDIRDKDILSSVTGSHGAYFEHEMTDQGHISILMLPTLLDIFQDRMNVGAAEHVNHTIENGLLEFELQGESASTDALSLDRGAASYMHQYVQFDEGRFEESNQQLECFLMQEKM